MKPNGANKWEVTPKELVKLCDGEYWLPVNSSEIFLEFQTFIRMVHGMIVKESSERVSRT